MSGRASKEARTAAVRREALEFLAGRDGPIDTSAVSFYVVNRLDPRGVGGVEPEHVRRVLERLATSGHVRRSRRGRWWHYEITDAGRSEATL